MTDSPDRTESIFAAAVALPSMADRAIYLDQACAQDAALRARIDGLLRAHDRAGHLLDKPVPGGLDQTQLLLANEKPGSVIAGRYKLIEAIGEGGMGSVWVAEQKEPVKRRVAIKLVKAGMDSRQVLARFDAERQALAMMDHPNIAKVFDGGMTEQGRPFFVMEYVKGVPLTEYCDQAKLSLKERLNLFLPICQAVQHAHQKGIIHRDLKPSNILICLYDGKPVPKVIDFGLAKAMHQALTDQSLYTAHGMMVGTPLYMSPEQAEHNNLDVDTRTDIYSLGVILYELLTGSTPLERQQLKEAAYNEILRLIKEVEPPKPSTRLSSSLKLPSIAAQRSIEPNQLKRSLTGDLDWIVMKALDKERSRRYETANGLSRDIERYLHDEAVEACPPSTAYRLQKLLRRNRGRVVAASLILLASMGGSAAVVAVQARANANLRTLNLELDSANAELKSTNTRLDQQRTRAEEREKQAIEAVRSFGDAVAKNAELKSNPSLESLRKTLLTEPRAYFQNLRDRLQADQDTRPESLARLASANFELGTLTSEIGNKEDALRSLQAALEIQEPLARENPTDGNYLHQLAIYRLNIGNVQRSMGHSAESSSSYQEAQVIWERLARENPSNTEFQSKWADSLNNLSNLLRETGRPQDALKTLMQTLEIQERLVRENPETEEYQSNLVRSHRNIGLIQGEHGNLKEGIVSIAKGRKISERLADENPSVAKYQVELSRTLYFEGFLLRDVGQPAEALDCFNRALGIYEGLTKENPTVTEYQYELARSLVNVGFMQLDSNRNDEAIESYSRASKILEKLTREHPTVTRFMSGLAAAYHSIGGLHKANGQSNDALVSYDHAREILETLVIDNPELPEFAVDLGGALNNIAMLETALGRHAKARQSLLKAIQLQHAALATNPGQYRAQQFLTNHLGNLILACQGLNDTEGVADAQRQLAELQASDPRFQALDARLDAIAKGESPNDNPERLALAQRAYETRRFALATQLFGEVVTNDPQLADDRQSQLRYNAACCAALALAQLDVGKDAVLNDSAQTDLRKQALRWLTAELDAWAAMVMSDTPSAMPLITQTMKHWQNDSDLYTLRDAEALERLPAPERADWEALWKRVEEILTTATPGETETTLKP